MRDDDFAEWLRSTYTTRNGTHLALEPRRDALSRCRRVEGIHGDLDAHYARDQMRRLIGFFAYSVSDARAGLAPAHGVLIYGNVRTGTASLRSALVLYKAFRDCR